MRRILLAATLTFAVLASSFAHVSLSLASGLDGIANWTQSRARSSYLTTEPELISNDPITYRTTDEGVTVTVALEELDTDRLRLTATITGVEGNFGFVTIATDNHNGTLTARTTNTGTGEVQVETTQSGECPKCELAKAAAAAATTAGCYFGGPVMCGAIFVGATAAATLYCRSDPCSQNSPSCWGISQVIDNRSKDADWPIRSPSSVSCTKEMEWISVETEFYMDGQLIFDNPEVLCLNRSLCEDNWKYFVPELAGRCFWTILDWEARWRYEPTNEIRTYAETFESNHKCF